MLFEFVLDEILAEFPLPDGMADVSMNRNQIAEALATSMPTVDSWIKKRMPVEQSGSNGSAYVFQLSIDPLPNAPSFAIRVCGF